MENVLFEYYIGDTYTRDFTIEGYSSPIDFMYFSVKKNNNDKRVVLQKTLGDGITLTDVVYDEDENPISRTYNILIDADDTEGLKTDYDYPFDIEIVTTMLPHPIKKTIISGIFRLKEATTRSYNES